MKAVSLPIGVGDPRGQEFPTPVIFAEVGESSLLGMVSLEEALLAVDPQWDGRYR